MSQSDLGQSIEDVVASTVEELFDMLGEGEAGASLFMSGAAASKTNLTGLVHTTGSFEFLVLQESYRDCRTHLSRHLADHELIDPAALAHPNLRKSIIQLAEVLKGRQASLGVRAWLPALG